MTACLGACASSKGCRTCSYNHGRDSPQVLYGDCYPSALSGGQHQGPLAPARCACCEAALPLVVGQSMRAMGVVRP